MCPPLLEELKQSKPFTSSEEELWLNLLRTASSVGHVLEQKLRPYGPSATQYNVLRILRGAGEAGLCQYEIRERLVAQVPDVPRILERMEKAGWVGRSRGAADRRMVMTSLTAEGKKLVDDLDLPCEAMMEDLFPGLSAEEMVVLSDLLAKARAGVE